MVNETPKELATYLAARIKQAIKSSGKSYEKIGEDVGVSKPAAHKWTKTGQIQLANLWALAKSTDKPMAWFFPGYTDGPADEASTEDAGKLHALLSDINSAGDADLLDDFLLEILEAKRALRDS
jgi:transcriptional regulator with XRE-family HTH domain